MKFNDLAWAAVCFYYRSAGDKRYRRMMSNHDFLKRLRQAPGNVSSREFEEQVVLGFINVEHYDLLKQHRLADTILQHITEVVSEMPAVTKKSLLTCDINDPETADIIENTFSMLKMNGMWTTGVSKIAHVLNDSLFPILSPELAQHFRISDDSESLKRWFRIVQEDIRQAADEFKMTGLPGSPEGFLSEKLGYHSEGYEKSLVKLADEYYWLRHGDCLPVPPHWTPVD